MGRLTAVRRKAQTETFDLEIDETRLVQGLARGLAVLRAFGPGDISLGNSELAERTGLARATISRLTETLAALGYLSFIPATGRYQLGSAVVALCHSLLAGMPHRIAARAALQNLAVYSRLPASLGMRDQLEMLTIETARHPRARPARFDLGSRLPIETTSMGRAYLYGLPAGERDALLRSLQSKYSKGEWRTVQARIDAAFASIASRGFCISLGDRRPDVFAVGAPVVTSDGTIMAINCGGLPSEASREYLETDLGPRLAQAASQISMEAQIGA